MKGIAMVERDVLSPRKRIKIWRRTMMQMLVEKRRRD